MDHGLQAGLSFLGGMFLSAAGFGWWSAAKYYGLKIEFSERLNSGMREVRHTHAGSIGQERVWREEADAELEARIRSLEDYRARRNGNDDRHSKT